MQIVTNTDFMSCMQTSSETVKLRCIILAT